MQIYFSYIFNKPFAVGNEATQSGSFNCTEWPVGSQKLLGTQLWPIQKYCSLKMAIKNGMIPCFWFTFWWVRYPFWHHLGLSWIAKYHSVSLVGYNNYKLHYKDLTATYLESCLVMRTIPILPHFRLVNYYNLPIHTYVRRYVYMHVMY